MAAVSAALRNSATSSGPKSHPYTCNTCQVAFKGSELQRGHMQSDWHRYNLKRRVASLPPLTSEIFAEKVLANQASAAATAAKASFEKICAACQRTYFSENAYDNHLKSQKHKARLAQLSDGAQEIETETASMVSSTISLGEPAGYVGQAPIAGEDPIAEAEFIKVADGIKDASLEEDGNAVDPMVQPVSAATSSTVTPLPTPSAVSITSDPILICLFCNETSSDMGQNISHMSKVHGLFVPEQYYLVDLPGLLSYLHERVQILHECLYCGHTKHTTTGIQTHMRDKGHCMIAFESEEEMIEVGQFYDFSSTYSDEEMEDEGSEDEDYVARVKQGGVKLGESRTATYTIQDDGDEREEGGIEDDWESDDSGEEEDQDMAGASETEDATSARNLRHSNLAYQIDHELHLPSGRTAGHRSLARYYRQNLHSYPTPSERLEQQQRLIESSEDVDTQSTRGLHLAVSRANGGLGMLGVSDAKKKEAMTAEIKDRRRVQRQQNRYQAGNERRANMQKHFRDPLLQ